MAGGLAGHPGGRQCADNIPGAGMWGHLVVGGGAGPGDLVGVRSQITEA